MKQELIFELINPNIKKWQLYKNLRSQKNAICEKQGVVIVARSFDNENYRQEVTALSSDMNSLYVCTQKILVLLTENNLKEKLISAKQFFPPNQTSVRMFMRLKKSHRTLSNFKKWEMLGKLIDQECRERNIYVNRISNSSEFSMTLEVSFLNEFDWAYIGFFAGHLLGKHGLDIDIFEPIIEPTSEDILDRITNLSGEHRQLSFDNILYMEKNGKRTKKSKAV